MADFTPRYVTGSGIKDVFGMVNGFLQKYSSMIIIGMLMVMMIFVIWTLARTGAIKSAVVTGKEKLYCNPGNRSPLCHQTRETLTSNMLATGYAANPNAFCANISGETTDPWGYLAETARSGTETESLSRYATRAEREDAALAIAMQH